MNSRAFMIGLCVTLALAGGRVYAQLNNPGFDAGLTDWNPVGDVVAATAGGNAFVVLDEREDPADPADPVIAAGRSRIFQEFTVPPGPQYLSFRYGLSSAPRAPGVTAPPDSFTAYLLDANGNRLGVGLGEPPCRRAGRRPDRAIERP